MKWRPNYFSPNDYDDGVGMSILFWAGPALSSLLHLLQEAFQAYLIPKGSVVHHQSYIAY